MAPRQRALPFGNPVGGSAPNTPAKGLRPSRLLSRDMANVLRSEMCARDSGRRRRPGEALPMAPRQRALPFGNPVGGSAPNTPAKGLRPSRRPLRDRGRGLRPDGVRVIVGGGAAAPPGMSKAMMAQRCQSHMQLRCEARPDEKPPPAGHLPAPMEVDDRPCEAVLAGDCLWLCTSR